MSMFQCNNDGQRYGKTGTNTYDNTTVASGSHKYWQKFGDLDGWLGVECIYQLDQIVRYIKWQIVTNPSEGHNCDLKTQVECCTSGEVDLT